MGTLGKQSCAAGGRASRQLLWRRPGGSSDGQTWGGGLAQQHHSWASPQETQSTSTQTLRASLSEQHQCVYRQWVSSMGLPT